jgi:aminoacyl tRNA synthase complex-interacting multifunctional protein 1
MMARTAALLDQLIVKLENRLGVTELSKAYKPDLIPDYKDLPREINNPALVQSEPEIKSEETKSIEAHKDIPDDSPAAPQSEPEKKLEENKRAQDSHEDLPQADLNKAPYELFPLIDIRVGKIVECWKNPTSDKLYCEKIDIGEEKLREIASGLQPSVPIEDMAGAVCVMTNLKPRKIGGFNSCGMVMALHTLSGFELLRPGQVEPGERIGLEGVLQPGKTPFLAVLNPKKKVLENSISYFNTDSEGFACFGVKRLLTSAGYIHTAHPNSKIS